MARRGEGRGGKGREWESGGGGRNKVSPNLFLGQRKEEKINGWKGPGMEEGDKKRGEREMLGR